MSKFKVGLSSTKEGNTVVIYTVTGLGTYPIIGQHEDQPGVWSAMSWSSCGRYFDHGDSSHRHDLMRNVEPMKAETECTIGFSHGHYRPFGTGVSEVLKPFLGKKIRLTIEELQNE